MYLFLLVWAQIFHRYTKTITLIFEKRFRRFFAFKRTFNNVHLGTTDNFNNVHIGTSDNNVAQGVSNEGNSKFLKVFLYKCGLSFAVKEG